MTNKMCDCNQGRLPCTCKEQAVTDVIAEDVAARNPYLQEIAEALGDKTLTSVAQVATGIRDMVSELSQQLANVSGQLDLAVKVIRNERYNLHAIQLRLNASEARNAELCKVLVAVRDDVGIMGRFAIDTLLGKPREHILYRDGDSIGCIPSSILDRNGQVALAMCTVCGKAESELEGPCEGDSQSAPATTLTYEVQWNSIHGPEGWKVVTREEYQRCQGPLWDRRTTNTAPATDEQVKP